MNSQASTNDDFDEEDDGGSNNDDVDDEDAAGVGANAGAGPALGDQTNGLQGGQPKFQGTLPSISSPVNNPSSFNQFHTYQYPTQNKDRPVLSNPNMTPQGQSNKDKMLDFLSASLVDVKEKNRLPPQ